MAETLIHDDVEDPVFEMTADSENIYDYVMFIAPTEAATTFGKLTIDVMMGYFLVMLTLFVQGLLLLCVYNRVVVSAQDWQAGIVHMPEDRATPLHQLMNAEEKDDSDEPKCRSNKALCSVDGNGTFSCAPPSVRTAAHWDMLDVNKDGKWSREEAIAERERLQCQFVVNPVEVFDVFIEFIKNRQKIIWIHPDVMEGKYIPKPYFDYARGDIVMCGYRNDFMCRNVLKRGYFDSALEFNTAPRVGNTAETALKYCADLLKTGGTCERFLPSTYMVWKIATTEECGGTDFGKFIYTHPVTGVQKSLLSVDYQARADYAKTQTTKFKVYKSMIIGIWIMSMVFELKRLIEIMTWALRSPTEAECKEQDLPLCELQKPDEHEQCMDPEEEKPEEKPEEKETPPDEEAGAAEEGSVKGSEKGSAKGSRAEEAAEEEPACRYKINGIPKIHKYMVIGITAFRFLMLWVLTIVGNSLLLQSPDYMSLLFDAVSLVFVIDLASMIAVFVLRESVRSQCADCEPIPVRTFGLDYLIRRPSIVDLSWFAFVVVATIFLMVSFYMSSVLPVDTALKCTCLGIGEKCAEAQTYNNEWWSTYWKDVTPGIFKAVRAMRESFESAGAEAAQAAAAAKKGSSSLLEFEADSFDLSALRPLRQHGLF